MRVYRRLMFLLSEVSLYCLICGTNDNDIDGGMPL
jgi:hypothetical protein